MTGDASQQRRRSSLIPRRSTITKLLHEKIPTKHLHLAKADDGQNQKIKEFPHLEHPKQLKSQHGQHQKVKETPHSGHAKPPKSQRGHGQHMEIKEIPPFGHAKHSKSQRGQHQKIKEIPPFGQVKPPKGQRGQHHKIKKHPHLVHTKLPKEHSHLRHRLYHRSTYPGTTNRNVNSSLQSHARHFGERFDYVATVSGRFMRTTLIALLRPEKTAGSA